MEIRIKEIENGRGDIEIGIGEVTQRIESDEFRVDYRDAQSIYHATHVYPPRIEKSTENRIRGHIEKWRPGHGISVLLHEEAATKRRRCSRSVARQVPAHAIENGDAEQRQFRQLHIRTAAIFEKIEM